MIARRKQIAILTAQALVAVSFCTAQSPKEISLQEKRMEIRAQLLKLTPIGSTSEQVRKSIQRNLLHAGETAPPLENHPAGITESDHSGPHGVKSIRLRLGGYLADPAIVLLTAPLISHKEVFAEWAFDKKDHLIEIFVDKTSRVY